MSFRSRRENREAEDTDMKVSHAKDKGKDKAADQSTEQQVSGQQSGQESGQPPEQDSDEKSDEEQSSTEEDKDDDAEPVPDGTTAEILKWVGDDPKRAQRALDKEQADDRPRTGLTGELNRILEQ